MAFPVPPPLRAAALLLLASLASPQPLPAPLTVCRGGETQSARWAVAAGQAAAPIESLQEPGLCLQIAGVGADARCQSACVVLDSCASPDPRFGGVATAWTADADGATIRVAASWQALTVGWCLHFLRQLEVAPCNFLNDLEKWAIVPQSAGAQIVFARNPSLAVANESLCCPTATAGAECSGHGVCGLATGLCTCKPCWNGYNCNAPYPGCVNGACNADGSCACKPCFTGANCATPVACGNGGVCDAVSGVCGGCGPCFSVGADGLCSVQNLCSGHGTCAGGYCTCADKGCWEGESCETPVVDCGAFGVCEFGSCACADPVCGIMDGGGKCSALYDCGAAGSKCVAAAGAPSCDCGFTCAVLGADGKCSATKQCGQFGYCPSEGVLVGWDDSGSDLSYMPMVLPIEGPLSTYDECWRRCNATPGCKAWGISLPPGVPGGCQIPTLCYLKSAEPKPSRNDCRITGVSALDLARTRPHATHADAQKTPQP
jgi:hypothetical protein